MILINSLSGWLSGHYANITSLLLCGVLAVPLAGSAIIYVGGSQGVKLFAYYLLSTGPSNMPLVLSMVNVNYKGSTKKLTITALLFISYCAGNM